MNHTTREVLKAAGITPAQWAIRWFGRPSWLGDDCGCPDDRCIDYHHDRDDECGCLAALLESEGVA